MITIPGTSDHHRLETVDHDRLERLITIPGMRTTGRMMSLLVSEGRKAPQTDEERSIAYRSVVAYKGKYTVDGDKWTTRPDVAWNEAWLTDQVRTFRLDGNKLTVETAPALNPNFGKVVRVILVWQREE
jgi:hypothetical protein